MTQNSFCEHIIKQKCQGKLLITKIFFIALYVFLLTLPSFAIIMFAPPNLIVPFLLVIASVVFILFKLTWKFTCVEFEYQIVDDSIIFSKIYGKSKRTALIEMSIKAFNIIGAYSEESEKYLKELLVDRSYLLISSLDAENIYFGVFDADGEKCIVFFEVTDTALQKLKKYGSGAMRAYERTIKQ